MIEKKESIYGVFINKKTNTKLAFYPCPKNANTSAKLFFLKHLGIEDKFKFVGDTIPLHKQSTTDLEGKINLVDFLPTKQPFSKVKVDVKCCILRDPFDRFISSYKNRILYHKDSSFNEYSVDMVLDKLENHLFENKHFLPQHFFLGKDLSYYNFCGNVNNIKYFEDKINDFFGKKIKFPRLQTGGNQFNVKLNEYQLRIIRKIYATDFELINDRF